MVAWRAHHGDRVLGLALNDDAAGVDDAPRAETRGSVAVMVQVHRVGRIRVLLELLEVKCRRLLEELDHRRRVLEQQLVLTGEAARDLEHELAQLIRALQRLVVDEPGLGDRAVDAKRAPRVLGMRIDVRDRLSDRVRVVPHAHVVRDARLLAEELQLRPLLRDEPRVKRLLGLAGLGRGRGGRALRGAAQRRHSRGLQ